MDDYVNVNFINYDLIDYIDNSKNEQIDDINYTLIETDLQFKLNTFINTVNTIDFLVNYSDIYSFCNYSLDKLTKQYNIDSVRQDIFYNGTKIIDTDVFLEFLLFKFNNKVNEILMFITQTIYAFIIQYIQVSFDKNIYVGEISNNQKKMQINIIYKDGQNIEIKSSKTLRIFKIINTLSYTLVEFNITFDICLNNEYVIVKLSR